jgi:hypothetical protein
MKIIISENSLKSFIRNKLGIDLTGKIRLISYYEDLNNRIKRNIASRKMFNDLLNSSGPFFEMKGVNDKLFIVQQSGIKDSPNWFGIDDEGMVITEPVAIKYLGLDRLGMTLNKVIDMYFDENEEEQQSITESKDSKINTMLRYVKMYTPELLDNELTEEEVTTKINLYMPFSVSNMAIKYIYSNKSQDLFVEYQDEEDSETRWWVNTIFEEVHKVFGEENFEYFIKEYYGLNISDKGEFKESWLFDEL